MKAATITRRQLQALIELIEEGLLIYTVSVDKGAPTDYAYRNQLVNMIATLRRKLRKLCRTRTR